jgi:ubiquinone biosynthesis protein
MVAATSAGEIAVRVVAAALLAVVTTELSLRLLGVRRGWTAALTAGVAGWIVGGLLALELNDHDWGADGLVLQMLVISVPTTMAVAVGLDLLAPPGTLARPAHAGLVTPPRPLRAVRRRVDVVRRYRELLGLIRAQGFGPLLGAGGKAERQAEPIGVRLRRVLEQAGGVYVKLGQIAATRVDLLPPGICEELATLQNRAPSEPPDAVRAVIEAELGPVDEVFARFDWEPLAAASIGQTHTARLPSGEEVVVKVQRPGIAEVMARDLAALGLLARLAERRTALGRSLRSGEVLDQFARSLQAELDFRDEVRSMVDMAALLAADSGAGGGPPPVRVARAFPDLCTARVLVQERFDGFTVGDADELAASDVDRRALASGLLRTVLRQVLTYGFFHADPHPGNVFVLRDGTLGLIDFGAVGRLDSIQRAAVVDMFGALIRSDVPMLRDAIERVTDVGDAPSGDQLERTLARLVAESVRPGGQVSPTALQDLVPALAGLGISVPGDLVLLTRALVTLDGTIGVLAPGMSVVSAALELAGPTAEAPADPEEMIRQEVLTAALRLRHLPDRIDRLATLATRGDLRLRTVASEDERRLLRTLVDRALLAVVGGAILLTSGLLLSAPEAGRARVGGTSLLDVLGYGGLLAGTVLVLRAVAAVARDGTT